jgi:hypothetical protein
MPTRGPDPLTDLDPLMLAEIIRRLIAVGVPPTAIANAFDMPAGALKTMARNVRRATYGTDEMAEAHTFMAWLAYEELLRILTSGSPEMRLKAAMQIQAKQMATTARQTPEEVSRARGEFAELVGELEITDAMLEEEAEDYETERSAFVPTSDDID